MLEKMIFYSYPYVFTYVWNEAGLADTIQHQHQYPLLRTGAVPQAGWNDQQLPRVDPDRAGLEVHPETAIEHHEYLGALVVDMPRRDLVLHRAKLHFFHRHPAERQAGPVPLQARAERCEVVRAGQGRHGSAAHRRIVNHAGDHAGSR